jgi:hypothetical protein
LFLERLGDRDAESAREVVVAAASVTHGVRAGSLPERGDRLRRRDASNRFD